MKGLDLGGKIRSFLTIYRKTKLFVLLVVEIFKLAHLIL